MRLPIRALMPVSFFGLYRDDGTATGDSLFGRHGNNPYSHYRVFKVSERGTRERTLMLGCVIALRYQVGLGSRPCENSKVRSATRTIFLISISKLNALAMWAHETVLNE